MPSPDRPVPSAPERERNAGAARRWPRPRHAPEPRPLFVYGTLRSPDVLVALIDRMPDHEPARVHGWRAAALPERVYPALVPEAGRTTDGLLLTGLTAGEWLVLDAYEGPGYELRRLGLDGGRQGWTYVCGPDVPVLDHDWSYDLFEARHRAWFVADCAGWRRSRPSSDATATDAPGDRRG